MLYSAGRDGIVREWSLGGSEAGDAGAGDSHVEADDDATDSSGDRSTDGKRSKSGESSSNSSSSSNVFEPPFRRLYEMHTSWVNDIALCENIGFLLTASSDCSLKIWDCRRCVCIAPLTKVSPLSRFARLCVCAFVRLCVCAFVRVRLCACACQCLAM